MTKTRAGKFNRLLKELAGKRGSVFDMDGNLVVQGKISYEVGFRGKELYVDDLRVPIRNIKNVPQNYLNGNPIIFIENIYRLERRVA
ncbi:hypothetical protein J4407_00815 [Candidatus Pacearchaeota archaeon]|nr:hypothetical protein [Candidatus Pacearchaeota archaeon]